MEKDSSRQDVSQFPVIDSYDLWLNYSADGTTFKLWSPSADEVIVTLYDKGLDGEDLAEHSMESLKNGFWSLRLKGDQQGKYKIKSEGVWMNETPGPYAQAVGVNGKRGYIMDLSSTDPSGWDDYQLMELNSFQDVIIYELHIRDMSIHPSSGIQNKGKYLGLAETGTKSPDGISTGIDHISDLGVTHALPILIGSSETRSAKSATHNSRATIAQIWHRNGN